MSKRKLKEAMPVIIILSMAAILCLILLVGPKIGIGQSDKSEHKLNIYFLNSTTHKLEPELRTIPKTDERTMMSQVLSELLAGPKEAGLSPTIPKDILLEVKITADNIAEVQLSEEYKNLNPLDELFCRASLVWTLTELDFVSDVHIYIGNEELLLQNGQPMGLLNRDNVIITDLPTVNTEKTRVTLYFSDDNAQGLVAEERELVVNPNQPVTRYLLEALITGPESPDLYRTIPTETQILDITVNEGVCYVDLNNDFMTKFTGGSGVCDLMLYSIVNSLTELSGIQKVQFLIEGKKVAEFRGQGFDLSKPLERNESLVLLAK